MGSAEERRENNERILCKRVLACSSSSFYAENTIVLLHEHSVRSHTVPLQQKTEHNALLVKKGTKYGERYLWFHRVEW